MPRGRKTAGTTLQPELLEVQVRTAPCVPGIREATRAWREGGYKGASGISRMLLDYWFLNDHRLPDGTRFAYHSSQREAIETIIFLFEVAKVRNLRELVERYSDRRDLRLLRNDKFTRYGIKMATGSGKTKVMSLVVAWQYFNSVVEQSSECATNFLLIAPNIIVFERLRSDFADGRIFRIDPVIPPELRLYWDFEVYIRGEQERVTSKGALYVTNVQQLYEPRQPSDPEPEALAAVLGSSPPAEIMEGADFLHRLKVRGAPICVLNDEAHHTHDEDSEWNNVIRRIHEKTGLGLQVDFSATPRSSKGMLFSWTVFDYPLKQAILDNVVKRPIKGVAVGITEGPSTIANVRYRAFLVAGVERWREYRTQLQPLNKKPILFVMMNSTADADDVGDWLRTRYPEEFGEDRLLVIHTDTKGEITKRDLDKARTLARNVDTETSSVNCVVSVLMLREGWDVQNVTVVVGLRPYTSTANILPEQTIGRGLRLMFRDRTTGYRERVDVIGNKAFIAFVEDLEKAENIDLETFIIGKDKLRLVSILVDQTKFGNDIAFPQLSPVLVRKTSISDEISRLDVMTIPAPVLPRKQGDPASREFKYEGYDLITLQKEIEKTYTMPEVQTPEEVIGYYARRIAVELKLPSQFAVIVPKVREFLEERAFGEKTDLNAPQVLRSISSNVAQYVTVTAFVKALRNLVIEPREPKISGPDAWLSSTLPFPFSRPTFAALKCIFNLVACDNELEVDFAKFLEQAPDVSKFAKLPEQFGFSIEYSDSVGRLRYYEPDFAAVSVDGIQYLIETKGRQDIDVESKDRAALMWCQNASSLSDAQWRYIKVLQSEFYSLQPTCLADLLTLSLNLE